MPTDPALESDRSGVRRGCIGRRRLEPNRGISRDQRIRSGINARASATKPGDSGRKSAHCRACRRRIGRPSGAPPGSRTPHPAWRQSLHSAGSPGNRWTRRSLESTRERRRAKAAAPRRSSGTPFSVATGPVRGRVRKPRSGPDQAIGNRHGLNIRMLGTYFRVAVSRRAAQYRRPAKIAAPLVTL